MQRYLATTYEEDDLDTVISWAATAWYWILQALAFVGLSILFLLGILLIALLTGSYRGSGSRDTYPDALKYREVNRDR